MEAEDQIAAQTPSGVSEDEEVESRGGAGNRPPTDESQSISGGTEPRLPAGKTPRVSLDDFFLGDFPKKAVKQSVVNMTKELRKSLKIAQLPAGGSRRELEDRYNEPRRRTMADARMSSSDDETQCD